MLRIISCLMLALVLAACVNRPTPFTTMEEGVIACPDRRPEVCTMDYRPVCAFLESGDRQEFSNGCTACSDPRVSGYAEGPCPNI